MKKEQSPRWAAYASSLASARGEQFIQPFLLNWKNQQSPQQRDFAFAQELSYGSTRMARALDYLATQLTPQGKLQVKLKERVFLRTALYQWFYMDRVPLYALANESTQLAHQLFHSRFVKFLSAILRRLEDHSPQLPQGMDPGSLAIRYSFPDSFVRELLENYGEEKTLQILDVSNQTTPTMARWRQAPWPDQNWITTTPFRVGIIDSSLVRQASQHQEFYIQNVTPATLIGNLAADITPPKTILDLCASPGGKTLAAADLFPQATIHANDLSEKKLERIKENLQRYQRSAHLSCHKGEQFPLDQSFDLLILDVPCSNTGVLGKRPEARWRLEEETRQLEEIQRTLLRRASRLVKEGGQIWYLTCSILPRENQQQVDWACETLGLERGQIEQLILPQQEGWDGGYGCCLQKKKKSCNISSCGSDEASSQGI